MSKIVLSQSDKNILDSFLAIVGLVVGWVSTNAGAFPMKFQALASLVGLVGGYFVSDAISKLDIGTLSLSTVATQVQTALDVPTVSGFLQSQIAKLPAQDQGVPQAALITLQQALAKAAATPAPPLMGTISTSQTTSTA